MRFRVRRLMGLVAAVAVASGGVREGLRLWRVSAECRRQAGLYAEMLAAQRRRNERAIARLVRAHAGAEAEARARTSQRPGLERIEGWRRAYDRAARRPWAGMPEGPLRPR